MLIIALLIIGMVVIFPVVVIRAVPEVGHVAGEPPARVKPHVVEQITPKWPPSAAWGLAFLGPHTLRENTQWQNFASSAAPSTVSPVTYRMAQSTHASRCRPGRISSRYGPFDAAPLDEELYRSAS
jgi:hypothetical protein